MQAGIEKEEVDFWDFYNCFPVAARIAIKTLDLSESIMPTVTGGLPYFGGPGNNYSMHAICQMVELLRKYPEKERVCTLCLLVYEQVFDRHLFRDQAGKVSAPRSRGIYA